MKNSSPHGKRLGLVFVVVVLALHAHMNAAGDASALELRATTVTTPVKTFTINLLRWPTDAERALLVAALAAPPAREGGPSSGSAAGGRGGARGRGARGGGAVPSSPMLRFAAAVKAAPTCGYIWGGVTGYSVKYAWRAPGKGEADRIILITDRRIATSSSPAPASVADVDADFTVLEIRLDGKGAGEGKTSPLTNVVVEEPTGALTLQDYAAALALFRINR